MEGAQQLMFLTEGVPGSKCWTFASLLLSRMWPNLSTGLFSNKLKWKVQVREQNLSWLDDHMECRLMWYFLFYILSSVGLFYNCIILLVKLYNWKTYNHKNCNFNSSREMATCLGNLESIPSKYLSLLSYYYNNIFYLMQ